MNCYSNTSGEIIQNVPDRAISNTPGVSVQTSQEQFFSFLNDILRRIYVSKTFWKRKRFGKDKLFSVIVTDMKYKILYVIRLWCLRRDILLMTKKVSHHHIQLYVWFSCLHGLNKLLNSCSPLQLILHKLTHNIVLRSSCTTNWPSRGRFLCFFSHHLMQKFTKSSFRYTFPSQSYS